MKSQSWRDAPPQHDVRRLYDLDAKLESICRGCGCHVGRSDYYRMMHADRETNYQWRVALPDWARSE